MQPTGMHSCYHPQRSLGKVMFLHVSVILFTGGGGWGDPSMHCRWYPSMPCSRSPGGWYPSMHCRWYASMPCRSPGGSPGPHPGGIPACSETDPPWTATAAGGTHPTGMHSCLEYIHLRPFSFSESDATDVIKDLIQSLNSVNTENRTLRVGASCWRASRAKFAVSD